MSNDLADRLEASADEIHGIIWKTTKPQLRIPVDETDSDVRLCGLVREAAAALRAQETENKDLRERITELCEGNDILPHVWLPAPPEQ